MHRCVLEKKLHAYTPIMGQAIYPSWRPSLTKAYMTFQARVGVVDKRSTLAWYTGAKDVKEGIVTFVWGQSQW